MGRHYAIHEWVDFLTEPGTPSQALRAKAARFAREAYKIWQAYPGVKLPNPTLSGSGGDADTADNIGYLAYQSIGGAGVGFWDNDDRLVPEKDKRALNTYMTSNKALNSLFHRLEEDMQACEERGQKKAGRTERLPVASSGTLASAGRLVTGTIERMATGVLLGVTGPAHIALRAGQALTENMRARFGDRQACATCGMDIEFHGTKEGWSDRGGNHFCDESGAAVPRDQDGNPKGRLPHRKHSPTLPKAKKSLKPIELPPGYEIRETATISNRPGWKRYILQRRGRDFLEIVVLPPDLRRSSRLPTGITYSPIKGSGFAFEKSNGEINLPKAVQDVLKATLVEDK